MPSQEYDMDKPPISVSLSLEQWNVVAAALAELPFKVSAPLIQEIHMQVTQASAGAGLTDAAT